MRNTFTYLTAFVLLTAFSFLVSLPGMAQNPGPAKAQSSASATGQNPGKVAGVARDAKGQPVESATMTLLNAADSAKVRVTATDKAGRYAFNGLPAGKYLISASSVGFATTYSP